MRITHMLNNLPKRFVAGAIMALAVLVPVAKTAADAVSISGSVGVGNVSAGENQFGSSTIASDGQTVKVQVYYKNLEAADSGKAATNVRVKVSIPNTPGAQQSIATSVAGDNTNSVNGATSVQLTNPASHLEYVSGSATWRHALNGGVVDSAISDAVASASGFVLEGQTAAGGESSVTVLARVVAAVAAPTVPLAPITPATPAAPAVEPAATTVETSTASADANTPIEETDAFAVAETAVAKAEPGQVGDAPRCTVSVKGARGNAFDVKNHVASVDFNVDGSKNCKVRVSTLAFYAPSMTGRPYDQQKLFDSSTRVLTPGKYTMSVSLPKQSTPQKGCFYQVDLTYSNQIVSPVLAYGHGTLDCSQPKPELVCKGLSATPVAGSRKVNFVATANAKHTTIKNYKFLFGDGSHEFVPTDKEQATNAHTYAEWNHEYTARVFVNSTDIKDETSANCVVTFKTSEKPKVPGVKIVKNVSKSVVKVGEQFTYTVTVTNNGETVLKNVAVTDPAPTNIKFLSADVGTVNATGSNWSANIASLAVGASKTYHITAKVTKYVSTQIVNTACVNAPAVNPEHPAQQDDCDNAPVGVQQPNPAVAIEKTVSKDMLEVGEEFTYTVKVTNTGDTRLTNVAVTDPSPAHIKFLSADVGTVNANGTNWSYTIPALGVGQSVTFQIQAKVLDYVDAQIVNRACVNAPAVNPSHPNQADMCANVPVEVVKHAPGVKIEKTVSKDMLEVGEEFTYTVRVTNTGDVDLHNVAVTDPAPTNIKFLSADEGTVNAAGTAWNATIANLAIGDSAEYNITAKVTTYSANPIVNQACVNAPEVNPSKPNKQDDCANVPVEVVKHAPGVKIEKTVSKPAVKVGEEFTYTVTVTNTGDVNLSNAVVSDNAPANVAFVSASEGTVTATKWTNTIPSLAIGESQTYTITAKVTKYVANQIVNTACVNAPEVNPSHPNKQDDCDDVPVIVQKETPSVVIEKTVSKETVKVGEEFTYTVRVTNNGDVDLTNVVVSDTAPTDVTFLGASEGTVTATKWTNTIPSLAIGESQTYTITAKVTKYVANQIVNTACVNAPEVNPSHPNKQDDCDDVPVDVEKPVTPVYSCDLLTLSAATNRTVTAGVSYTAAGGAAIKSVTFDFGAGDGSVVTTNSTVKVYQYAADGTYTVTARVLFDVNGADQYGADNKACMKQVTYTTPEEPGVVLGTTTPGRPSVLPNTGAAGVIGIVSAITLAAAFGHRLFFGRKATS